MIKGTRTEDLRNSSLLAEPMVAEIIAMIRCEDDHGLG